MRSGDLVCTPPSRPNSSSSSNSSSDWKASEVNNKAETAKSNNKWAGERESAIAIAIVKEQ